MMFMGNELWSQLCITVFLQENECLVGLDKKLKVYCFAMEMKEYTGRTMKRRYE